MEDPSRRDTAKEKAKRMRSPQMPQATNGLDKTGLKSSGQEKVQDRGPISPDGLHLWQRPYAKSIVTAVMSIALQL